MVNVNSITSVPIDSILVRCSMANNPANKPESIENNKQAYVRHCRCFVRMDCLLSARWLVLMLLFLLLLLLLMSLLRLACTADSSYCCRNSCCKWFNPNFPNNLNVESFTSVDSIVCITRCCACSTA